MLSRPFADDGKKTALMTTLFFLVCVVHMVLINLSDALVVTTSGAESIPFIHLWILLPASVFGASIVKRTMLKGGLWLAFLWLVGGFLLFFVLYAAIFYPCRATLCPEQVSSYFLSVLPIGLSGAIATVKHWPLSMLFLAGELWSNLVTSMIIFAIANEITSLSSSAQRYSWMRTGGACGTMAGGFVPLIANWLLPTFSVELLMGVIIFLCGSIILLGRYFVFGEVNATEHFRLTSPLEVVRGKDSAGGIATQWRTLFQSSYMTCLLVIVFGYNMSMNIFSLVWRLQINEIYPTFNECNAVFGCSSIACGLLTIVLSGAAPFLLSRFGWTVTAFLSPLIQLVLTVTFFGFILAANLQLIDTSTAIVAAVWVGAAQYSAGRAMKFSVFDVTKDMAFIPLPSDIKASGKAAVESLGASGGRSSAALIHQSVLLAMGSVHAGVPILSLLVIGTIALWLGAVRNLGVQFQMLTRPLEGPNKTDELAATA
jgi:AAA family ATP:ADP antiporter